MLEFLNKLQQPLVKISDADRAAAIARAQKLKIGGGNSGKKNWSPQTPTERQKTFLDLPHLEAFYGGAAGGGKSSTLLMAALQSVEVPNYSALLLRRTYQDLAKPGALMDRAHDWLRSSGAKWNEQKKQWRFPSGAVLAFGYLENERDKYQYQGAEYQFIGFDELTQFPESAYTYLFSRLRRLKTADVTLRMRSASNPGGIGAGWVQERFIPEQWTPVEAAKAPYFEKEGRAFVPAKLKDNPFVDRESYEGALQNLSEVERAQLLDGDWQVRERGNIYPMWSDGYNGHHVITWSQFAAVFGQSRIPGHWKGAQGQDWGFDPDPCANVWNFVSAANSPLPGRVFCPRILTAQRMVADEVAEAILLAESVYGETSRIEYRVLSHEANSEREVYARKGLNYQKPLPDANGGIAQMRHKLMLHETDKPHPFKSWLTGQPSYYVVVPDEQLINPRGDEGLAMLREEFAVYRYIDGSPTIQRGTPRIVPYDFFNHFMDAQRMVAGRWFPSIAPLSKDERIQAAIPEFARLENLRASNGVLSPAHQLTFEHHQKAAVKKVERESAQVWRSDRDANTWS